MCGAVQDDTQIHPEVEHLEYLALREPEHDDAAEFRQRNTGKHRASHRGKRVGRPFEFRRLRANGEAVHEMRAEFDGDPDGHHQIY